MSGGLTWLDGLKEVINHPNQKGEPMPERVCDVCGKKKSVSDAITCEKGHFICSSCKRVGGLFSSGTRSKCPICGKPAR